mmetsp:Transcript_1825/g.3856  ORF Transcript_1825/g.3856 Transcript_1825/m.3856 type:complete len:245 (-) Transcript_1825:204-938(-)
MREDNWETALQENLITLALRMAKEAAPPLQQLARYLRAEIGEPVAPFLQPMLTSFSAALLVTAVVLIVKFILFGLRGLLSLVLSPRRAVVAQPPPRAKEAADSKGGASMHSKASAKLDRRMLAQGKVRVCKYCLVHVSWEHVDAHMRGKRHLKASGGRDEDCWMWGAMPATDGNSENADGAGATGDVGGEGVGATSRPKGSLDPAQGEVEALAHGDDAFFDDAEWQTARSKKQKAKKRNGPAAE